MIELHSQPTPNGQKVMIMLEEAGLEWKHFDVNIHESVRIYRVMDNQLAQHAWIAGDEYTIADMAIYPWTKGHKDRGVDEAGYPNFIRWFRAMEARPAVQRNNKMADEIRARMNKAAEGKTPIEMFNTADNAQRLARATGH